MSIVHVAPELFHQKMRKKAFVTAEMHTAKFILLENVNDIARNVPRDGSGDVTCYCSQYIC